MESGPRAQLSSLAWSSLAGGLVVGLALYWGDFQHDDSPEREGQTEQSLPLIPGGLPKGARLTEFTQTEQGWEFQGTTPDEPLAVARALAETASSAGWDAYASRTGGQNAELRLYAGPRLGLRLVLRHASPEHPSPAGSGARTTATARERHPFALVVFGLDNSNAHSLLAAEVPLGFALRPYHAQTLALSREVVRNGHEVVLDLPRSEAENAEARSAALQALPFASAMFFEGPPPPSVPTLPFGVWIHPQERGSPANPDDAGVTLLAAEAPSNLEVALASLQESKAQDRIRTFFLDADNPLLRELLIWAKQDAARMGFRIVLPSEAARPAALRGPNDTEPDAGGAMKGERPKSLSTTPPVSPPASDLPPLPSPLPAVPSLEEAAGLPTN